MSNKRILFCAAESAHLAKVGGLADVIASLPGPLNKSGLKVRVIMPAHANISLKKIKAKKLASFKLSLDKTYKIELFSARVSGVYYYLIKNKDFFSGAVYEGDNTKKYLFFSQAVLASLPHLKFKPDIIHAHDFHSAGIILGLKAKPEVYKQKTVLTIHNLYFQGWVDKKILKRFKFDLNNLYEKEGKSGTSVNILASAIKVSDKISTVSPNYSKEILSAEYGEGLEKLLLSRKKDLLGILNGIDQTSYDPAKDKSLAFNYSSKNIVSGKKTNQTALREYLDLDDNNLPVLGMTTRLSNQKGLDLFHAKDLASLLKKYPFQLIILGTGDPAIEESVKELEKKFPANLRAIIAFDDSLARNIYAASDFFLIPSRFEPCGLTQMISMNYGTIPVVRKTGGLKDTVTHRKTGFVFKDYNSKSLMKALEQALALYYNNPDKFKSLRRDLMKVDWSWDGSAKNYIELYNSL